MLMPAITPWLQSRVGAMEAVFEGCRAGKMDDRARVGRTRLRAVDFSDTLCGCELRCNVRERSPRCSTRSNTELRCRLLFLQRLKRLVELWIKTLLAVTLRHSPSTLLQKISGKYAGEADNSERELRRSFEDDLLVTGYCKSQE